MPPNLDHIYWLGGSPCAGKSSIAEQLAAEFGLTLYHVDSEFERQQKWVTAVNTPTIFRTSQMSCDELWLRPVPEQLAGAIQYYTEHFGLILADLRRMPADKPILAEGTALLPTAVAPLLNHPGQALWMVPTEPFQRQHYAKRPWIHGVLQHCSQPALAFENWMQRDVAFDQWVLAETAKANLSCHIVDGKQSLAENYHEVARTLSLKKT